MGMYESEDQDQESEVIIPRYKMIMSYDVLPHNHDTYYQFVLGELVPAMQEMGIYMTEVWHTAYGNYPIRMTGFVSEDYESIQSMLGSERWHDLEDRLLSYVRNYSCKVVEYRQGFQCVRS